LGSVPFLAKFKCGILVGNQFGCGQVSRHINVTDKVEGRGRVQELRGLKGHSHEDGYGALLRHVYEF
jgi:hypothetical protein